METKGAESKQEKLATIIAEITGIGVKKIQVPLSKVDATIEKIARCGFSLDNGEGRRVVYLPNKIEKLDIRS